MPTSLPVLLSPEECADAAVAAVEPLQAFIDEYEGYSVDEWNALDPPPDTESPQLAVQEAAQAAVDQGCDPAALETALLAAIAELEGTGEVGEAIAAALRGDDPLQGPPGPIPVTTLPRDTTTSTAIVEPGDDLAAVLAQVAEGSTIRFTAGVHEFADTILVGPGVNFVGAGRDRTILRSTAEGVAVAFTGPGGFAVRNMTIEHAGDAEASVLLAIEGPITLRGARLTGAKVGSGEAGGGHGLVLAFENLPGFPERTPEERAGALVVSDSTIDTNEAAGILSTGAAAPEVSRVVVRGNGGCGICFTGSATGTVVDSTIESNQIGVQAGDASTPTLERNRIALSTGVGISVDGTSAARIVENTIEDNTAIGVQASGSATPTIERNTFARQGVGVLATDTAAARVAGNTFNEHEIGVQASGQAVVETAENAVWNSAVAAVSYGDTSAGVVRDNGVVGAATAGIQMTGSAQPEVTGNSISGGGVGISFVDTSRGAARNNEIAGNDVGIQLGGTASAEIGDNVVRDPAAVGILFGDGSSGTASGNQVTGAGAVGILAAGTSSPSVRDNTLSDNNVGLVFRERARGTATGNTVENHVIGVQVVDQAAPTIEGNTVRDSSEAGVVFGGSAAGRFRGNTLSSNGSIGMQVGESARPTISGNEIRGQSVYGILFRDSGAGTVSDNTIVDHVFGIQLGDFAAPSIRNNTLRQIALTNIVYADNTGGEVVGNSCESSLGAGISVSAPANPTVGENDCTVSRTG